MAKVNRIKTMDNRNFFTKLFNLSLFLIAGLVVSTLSAKQISVQEKNLNKLIELTVGEFNNYNQINFQDNDFIEEKITTDYSRLHHIRQKINSPNLDGHWVYAQINRLDRDGEIYRQSYMHYFIDEQNQIKARSYKLTKPSQEKTLPSQVFLDTLSKEQLVPSMPEGCDTHWQRELEQFTGVTDHNTCVIDSKYKKNQKRQIFSEEIIGEKGLWGREGAYTLDGELAFGLEAPNYYKYHRVRPMTCWTAVHLQDDEWEFYRDLKTHSEGGSVSFGKERQYRLQLKQTEFIASDWSDAFELFIYKGYEEKAIAYSWTEPTAKHIAVNLREVQASCKLQSEN